MTVHKLMTPEELAKLLKVTVRTLADWRVAKKGPPHINMNGGYGAVRYPEDMVTVWQQAEFDRSFA